MISAARDVAQLGTIMGIWAHPDDETFTSAGIMAAAVKNGQKVICVTATKGEGGVQDESKWPAAQLGEIRENELRAALEIIGVKKLHFLGFSDGSCTAVNQVAIAKVVKLIETYRPDTILTFGADGLTGHPDHRAVYKWVVAAAQKSVPKPIVYHAAVAARQYEKGMADIDKMFNYFYNVEAPRLVVQSDCAIYFELKTDLKAIKYAALERMPSQYSELLNMFSKDTICSAFSVEAFIRQD